MFKGYLLREVREKAGYTLIGLAKALEKEYGFLVVDYTTLSQWETSPTAKPRKGNLKRVASFLDIPVSDSYDDANKKNDIETEEDILSLIEKIILLYKNNPDDIKIEKIRTLLI